jgi:signal transduction histidine kinase
MGPSGDWLASGYRRATVVWAALLLLNIVAICIWPCWVDAAGIPLLAAMFVVVARQAGRKRTADRERRLLDEQNSRLLDAQRRFLQDAPHHLRAPLTNALTHAEQLAQDLSGRELSDIQTVAGEMIRLRRLMVSLPGQDDEREDGCRAPRDSTVHLRE